MTRKLALLLLLHHIEGVCKPWSAATLAARELLLGFVQQVKARDVGAAVLRAQKSQAAAVERARQSVRRQVEARRPARGLGRAATHHPAAIEAVPVVAEVVDRVRQYQERGR
jgi:hypothetical protein